MSRRLKGPQLRGYLPPNERGRNAGSAPDELDYWYEFSSKRKQRAEAFRETVRRKNSPRRNPDWD